MKNKQPPRILTDAGLSMFVNTMKLRELPLPVVDIDTKELMWHFDMPVWEKDGTDDWNLTPREVIDKKEGSTGHQKKVKTVDTSFPLVITKYNSRYVILDGVHRLIKAYIRGDKKIKAKIIPKEYLSLREFQSLDRDENPRNNSKKWSGRVTKESNALDLEPGVFTFNDPVKIAESLKKSAESSARRKGTAFQSAMSMLNFYINRAGKNLPVRRRKILNAAKEELRKQYKN